MNQRSTRLAATLRGVEGLRGIILLPVVRPPYFLPNAIERVLAQTAGNFELFVVCDGAPAETVNCAQEFARRDSRVHVRDFPKGERVGEAHLHTVLANTTGDYVAYLEDDDLWFPNHLEELGKVLRTADFGTTIHVTGYPDDHVEALPCDLGNQEFRQRFVDEIFNRFGYSFCGHRLDAYRRLTEGWVPTPHGIYPDLHMWRKFFRVREFKFGTRMVITAVALPSYVRGHMSLDERAREATAWVARIVDQDQRAEIIEAAWRSIMDKEIRCEREVVDAKSSQRQTEAALGQMEALNPGSLQTLGRAVEAQVNAEQELERLKEAYNVIQYQLTFWTNQLEADRKKYDAATAAYAADLIKLNGKIAELERAQNSSISAPLGRLMASLRTLFRIS